MAGSSKAKPADAGEGGEEKPAGGRGKLIILLVAGLVVLGGGGGAAAWWLGLFGGGAEAADAAAEPDAEHADASAEKAEGEDGDHAEAAKAEGEHAEEGHGETAESGAAEGEASGEHAAEGGGAEGAAPVAGALFVDMPDVLVNLQAEGRRMRFLKLGVALEVADEPTALAVRQLAPRVLDSFQLYLRTLTVEDLRGAAPVHRMKEELLARVNDAIAPQRVEDVLIKEMLVQ